MIFICLTDLSTSRNTISLPVMSGKLDGGPISKHQNTGPTERQNRAVCLTLNNIPLDVNLKFFVEKNIPVVVITTFQINIGNISVM